MCGCYLIVMVVKYDGGGSILIVNWFVNVVI